MTISKKTISEKNIGKMFKNLTTTYKQKGAWAVIKECLIYLYIAITVTIISLFGIIIFNPDQACEYLLNKINTIQADKHSELIEYRTTVTDPNVRIILKEVLLSTGASRACVFEEHNGINNTSGMPFLLADMKYEEVQDGQMYRANGYKNLDLSSFSFIRYAANLGYWEGTVKDIENVDRNLAYRLISEDVNYIAATIIYGSKGEIGFMVITYSNGETLPTSDINIIKILIKASSKAATYLDATMLKK
jgi:hypothetical protein